MGGFKKWAVRNITLVYIRKSPRSIRVLVARKALLRVLSLRALLIGPRRTQLSPEVLAFYPVAECRCPVYQIGPRASLDRRAVLRELTSHWAHCEKKSNPPAICVLWSLHMDRYVCNAYPSRAYDISRIDVVFFGKEPASRTGHINYDGL